MQQSYKIKIRKCLIEYLRRQLLFLDNVRIAKNSPEESFLYTNAEPTVMNKRNFLLKTVLEQRLHLTPRALYKSARH